VTPSTSTALLRRGLTLEALTLAWNVVGVGVVAVAAIRAHSVALAGFGLDSLIEIFASLVVIWQLTGANKDREQRALRLIGYAFFALALYILAQLLVTVLTQTHPAPSTLGIAWLGATLLAKLGLAYSKRITGRRLGNPVLTTEAHVTLIDAYLAAAVLLGLGLNALLGWWWADPLAGLVIVYYALREGWEAIHA
jgi:divalent metal cation (Fe/Co/Zn/Cd) transporter